MSQTTVIVLAGKRSGALDALAGARGVSHKCIIPVLDQPLISHVLETIALTLPDAQIRVSIEDFSVIADIPVVKRLLEQNRIAAVEAQANLVESVALAVAQAHYPVLITTADNALLTPQAIMAMLKARPGADALVALARKEQIIAAHPTGKNRYYEFRNGGFSNCNLFLLRGPRAIHAAEAFRTGGQFLKTKGRMLKTFGLLSALMYRTGWFTVEKMFERVSARLGVDVRPVVFEDGRLAIDVDDESSLRAVEDILKRSAGQKPQPALA
ncbi:NTP transferase domain-containing protein [Blastomonas sp.]|uniref:NTP transferase domain-containing protein n=1 Tax=Blastomonas sp. TaxID=1909299 RepID=UPI00260DF85B|nr:NTP transferase domain-containing protein [Blastomonas sp.]MDM7956279.1 NTP transferase domain-containing protein [Blastomonas sp.]